MSYSLDQMVSGMRQVSIRNDSVAARSSKCGAAATALEYPGWTMVTDS